MAKKPGSSASSREDKNPWIEKYRPKSLKEMALPRAKLKGQKVDLAEELTQFVRDFFKNMEKINEANKKIRAHNRTASSKDQKDEMSMPTEDAAVLMEGPPGIGKTSIVYALANDLNMEVVETNASDTRTRDALEMKLKETSKSRGIMDFITQSKKKLLLVDEVDGIYGNADRGAVPAIIELIKTTQFPILMCSNEYKRNLQSLYRVVRKLDVDPLSEEEVMKIARTILKKENVKVKNSTLEAIVKKNGGDLRGVINDLQGMSQGLGTIDDVELLKSLNRDTTEEIFNLIRALFQEAMTLRDARAITDKSDVDYAFLYKWVHENLPTFIKRNEDLERAYESLSMADEIFGRIRKNQFWSILPYFFDLFAGGVVLAQSGQRSRGFRRIYSPKFMRSRSLTIAENSLIEKINEHYEISPFEAMQDFLPFLKELCNTSRKELMLVSNWLELDAKEKKVLKKK